MIICHCSKCGASSANVTVSVYNDFDDEPGFLVCDPCIYAEAIQADHVEVIMPKRPEGYYHCAPGTFD